MKNLVVKTWNYFTSDINLIKEGGTLFLATLIANILSYFFQFAMGRLLGPADYGVFGALFAIIYLLLAPITTIQTVTAKFVSEFRARNEHRKICGLFWRALKKLFLYSFIIFILFLLLSKLLAEFLNFPEIAPILVFSVYMLVAFVIPVLRGFLQGLQRFKTLGINLILDMGLKLVLGVVFVLLGWRIIGALFGVIFGTLFAFVVAFLALKQVRSIEPTNFQSEDIYKYSFPVLAGMLAIAGMYTFDVILVKHYFSPLDAGHYAAASLLAKIIFFASMAISQVMLPKVAELYALNSQYKPIFNKAFLVVLAMSTFATATYFIAPNFIIGLLFGKEYLTIAPLIGLFSIAMGLFSLCYVIINYLLSINKTGVVFLPMIFCSVEVILIFFLHNSLMQVIKIISVVVFLLFISLITVNRNEIIAHHTRV